jgi:hypothetical protein
MKQGLGMPRTEQGIGKGQLKRIRMLTKTKTITKFTRLLLLGFASCIEYNLSMLVVTTVICASGMHMRLHHSV